MSNIQELEKRVTAAERGLEEVRILAVGASEDTADYRAVLKGHTASLNALRVTQLEQSAALEKLSGVVGQQSEVLGKQSEVIAQQSAVLQQLTAEFKVMREAQFQHAVEVRTVRETQMRHYVEHEASFAEIKSSTNRIERLMKRPDAEFENRDS